MVHVVRRLWVSSFVVAVVLLSASSVAAQGVELQDWQNDELVPLADTIANYLRGRGEVTPTSQGVALRPMYFKGVSGQVYVPFTLSLDASLIAESAMVMYLFIVDPGVEIEQVQEEQLALSSAPSAAVLGAEPEIDPTDEPPLSVFENGFFSEVTMNDTGQIEFSRAFQAPGGVYDLYLAVRGSSGGDTDYDLSASPITLLTTRVTVPDQWDGQLTSSTMFITGDDAIQTLNSVPDAEDLRRNPFTFGNTRITPRFDPTFGTNERMAVIFFVYNPSSEDGRTPNVSVGLSFYTKNAEGEEFFNNINPLEFNAETLDDGFDLTLGNQIVVDTSVPLRSFPPATYRLEIKVTDNVSSIAQVYNSDFTVESR
jgi:hypothetical protein